MTCMELRSTDYIGEYHNIKYFVILGNKIIFPTALYTPEIRVFSIREVKDILWKKKYNFNLFVHVWSILS